MIDFAYNLINEFSNFVTSAWNDLVKLVSEGIQWIMGLWNDLVAKVMGPITEMEKNIATLEVNFVVDTVWNYIIEPLLPSNNSFSLPSTFQSIINMITDPTLATNWVYLMNTTISPFTAGLSSMKIDIPSGQSAFSLVSNGLSL